MRLDELAMDRLRWKNDGCEFALLLEEGLANGGGRKFFLEKAQSRARHFIERLERKGSGSEVDDDAIRERVGIGIVTLRNLNNSEARPIVKF